MIIRLWQADFFGLFLPPSYFALSGFSVKRQKLRQTQIVFADKTVCKTVLQKARIMQAGSIKASEVTSKIC